MRHGRAADPFGIGRCRWSTALKRCLSETLHIDEPVIDSLFNTLFRCSHRRTTFPLTPARKTGADASGIYVVCLDCGKQFVYDWEHMRIEKPVDIAAASTSAGAEGPRIPFNTKRTLRYLAWASAVSAAWALGRSVKSRRHSQLSDARTSSSHGEAQAPPEAEKAGEHE